MGWSEAQSDLTYLVRTEGGRVGWSEAWLLRLQYSGGGIPPEGPLDPSVGIGGGP